MPTKSSSCLLVACNVPLAFANTLYYGDNLDILREHIAGESVDLIYLDPPFNSNRTYNVLFKDESGHESAGPDQGLRRHLALEHGRRGGLQRAGYRRQRPGGGR